MFALKITVVAILATSIVISGQPIGDSDSNEVKKPRIVSEKMLLNGAKNFACQPQKRSFLVQDLLKKNNILLETNEKIRLLTSIVLHRCDQQSGCCLQHPGQQCAELISEPVVLQFQVIKPDGTKPRLLEIEEFNHTMCACQNIAEIKRRINNEYFDPSVHSLTSTGLSNNRNEHKLLLCVALLLYFIYLFEAFCF